MGWFGIPQKMWVLAAGIMSLALLNYETPLFAQSAPAPSVTPSVNAEDAVNRARENRAGQFGQIDFDKTVHDFGQIQRGAKVAVDFGFVNRGRGKLVLQGVHASCGCTAVEVDSGREYEPGQSGSIRITFDSTDFLGRIAKGITVVTNERQMSDRTLTVRAVVVAEFDVDPPLVDFGEVYARAGVSQMVTIRPDAKFGNSFSIDRLKFNPEYLDVGYAREGSRWVVTVKLKPNAQTGFFKETVFVVNNSKSLPELPIPVRGTVRGNIEFTPRYLEFGQIAPQDKGSRSVTLKTLEEVKITGTRAELNINGARYAEAGKIVEIESIPHEKGKQLLTINLRNAAGLAGAVHGKVMLETDDPQQKTVTVDFYAFFR